MHSFDVKSLKKAKLNLTIMMNGIGYGIEIPCREWNWLNFAIW